MPASNRFRWTMRPSPRPPCWPSSPNAGIRRHGPTIHPAPGAFRSAPGCGTETLPAGSPRAGRETRNSRCRAGRQRDVRSLGSDPRTQVFGARLAPVIRSLPYRSAQRLDQFHAILSAQSQTSGDLTTLNLYSGPAIYTAPGGKAASMIPAEIRHRRERLSCIYRTLSYVVERDVLPVSEP